MKNPSVTAGFTMIETIIAVAILMILTGFGVAGFIRFNDRQQVLAATKQVQLVLRTAQANARSRVTPTGCVQLQSVLVETSGNDLITKAECESGDYTMGTWSLPSAMSMTPNPMSVSFRTLHGGVISPSGIPLVITVQSTNFDYQFEVSGGGDISMGQFL
jgi:type II secretory pathway pseudopilin PulG